MLINHLGNNLNILIKCNYSYAHDWMAFACWYSLDKFLPDAKVIIACTPTDVKEQVFTWPKRVGVPMRRNLVERPVLVLDCDTVIIRDLVDVKYLNEAGQIMNGQEIISEANSEDFTPFVSYKNGCGNFVTAQWINTTECPFPWADRFMTHSATINEVKVLKLWKQLCTTYATVSRG